MYSQYDNMGMYNMVPKRSINWNNILNNTQRTLGIINQAIPIVYQVKPLLGNARTLFKIAGALNDDEDISDGNNDYNTDNISSNINDYDTKKDSNGPIFYL